MDRVKREPPEMNDSDASTRLATFDQHRSLLFSIAYRMLGSVADTEDILQEAFLRWQQSTKEDIRSPRAYLITIVSRLCINYRQSARVLREEYVGQWLPEPIVTDVNDSLGLVKLNESLSMAFLLLLERLTPVERAVFLLRETFEYEYSEIATILGRSETNCRQILHRARHHVTAERPRFAASEKTKTELLERFLEASNKGDLEGLIALLSQDVVLHSDGGGKAIAVPNLIHGAENVARGVLGSLERLVPKNLVQRRRTINGEPGLITYSGPRPFCVLTLRVSAGRIDAIYVLTNPEKLSHLPGLSHDDHKPG